MNIDQSFPRTDRLVRNTADKPAERNLRKLLNRVVVPLGMPAFGYDDALCSVLDRMEQFLRVRNLPVNYADE